MILFKKAIRSMLDNKKAYIACIVLIAVGIAIYCSMGISSIRLEVAKDVYYEENRMADIFAQAQAIPSSAKSVLQRVEGIAEVSLGLKYDARVIMPGNDKIITMRLVSVDPQDENAVNKISYTGNGFYADNDLIATEGFLAVHHLEVGDSLTLIVDGREVHFNICGTGSSPEYVYMIKDAVEVLPDDETFSVAFIQENSLANMLDKKGVYSDAAFILEESYSFDDVKTGLEDALSPYGMTALTDKKDQLSYSTLESEISSNLAMAGSIPMVFVLIAMVILYLMMKRVIEQDRMQIGTLKAFGYSNFSVVTHYLVYGLTTGLTGGLTGVVGGYLLSGTFTEMYNQFYHLPAIHIDIASAYVVRGLLIAAGGGVLGAYMGARSVIKLIPSEAMRAVAPKVIKNDGLEYLPFLRHMLNAGGRMAVRSIMRSKVRSGLIIAGVMFSFGLLAFMGSYTTMVDDMLMNQFSKVQLYDAKIIFKKPVDSIAAVESVKGIDGVSLSEALLEIPVEFKNRHRKQGIVITGIQEDSMLYKIYDNDLKVNRKAPKDGVMLSSSLAQKLEAKTGDVLYLSSPLAKDDLQVIVTGIVTQNLGMSSYMEKDALEKLFGLGDSATSAILKAGDMGYLKEYLKDAKNVAVIEDKVKTLEQYNNFMGSYSGMIYIMQAMAVAVAFAIIYNTATISLSERKREFATLRVLGMQVKEVAGIMAFEYQILGLLGIILGFPFTMFLKETLARAIEIDMFTFPTYTPPYAYVTAMIGCMLAVFVSNRSSVKNIRGFDMVEVLKERE